EGYIILEKGDTIHGELVVQSDVSSCNYVALKNQDGEILDFKKKEVKAYKRGSEEFVKKEYQIPGRLGITKGYLKVLEKGEVILYELKYSNNAMGPNGTFYHNVSTGTAYFLEKENTFFRVKKSGFKRNMALYFADNAELSRKIKEKELKYRNIQQIVQIYNKELKEKENQ
ncbi:MAG: hypothetical protein K8R53_07040, partial [Bacteroidales bacterium]|nr:hypothetical protein [Bacteroidales bacterium]